MQEQDVCKNCQLKFNSSSHIPLRLTCQHTFCSQCIQQDYKKFTYTKCFDQNCKQISKIEPTLMNRNENLFEQILKNEQQNAEKGDLSQQQLDKNSREKCKICYKEYNQEFTIPLKLDCGHAFCKQCILKQFNFKDFMKCFICEQITKRNPNSLQEIKTADLKSQDEQQKNPIKDQESRNQNQNLQKQEQFNKNQSLKEIEKCLLCLSQFNSTIKIPILLECEHLQCQECVKFQYEMFNRNLCKKCNKTTRIAPDKLIVNESLLNEIRQNEDRQQEQQQAKNEKSQAQLQNQEQDNLKTEENQNKQVEVNLQAQCEFCAQEFDNQDKIPLKLPCQHTFCSECILQQYISFKQNKCFYQNCQQSFKISPIQLLRDQNLVEQILTNEQQNSVKASQNQEQKQLDKNSQEKCKSCNKEYNQEDTIPLKLDCGHAFCNQCLIQEYDLNKFMQCQPCQQKATRNPYTLQECEIVDLQEKKTEIKLEIKMDLASKDQKQEIQNQEKSNHEQTVKEIEKCQLCKMDYNSKDTIPIKLECLHFLCKECASLQQNNLKRNFCNQCNKVTKLAPVTQVENEKLLNEIRENEILQQRQQISQNEKDQQLQNQDKKDQNIKLNPQEEVNLQVQCEVCKQEYDNQDQTPLKLDCNHTFCQKCIGLHYMTFSKIKC